MWSRYEEFIIFTIGNDGNKCAIICQGESNTSIGSLHFCLNNNTSTHNINANLNDDRFSMYAGGTFGMSGTLTVTGAHIILEI